MRYTNSVLGSVWSVLNPLANILVYTLIFSNVTQSRLPGVNDTLAYSIYLCSGLLPWNYFVETLLRTQGVFLEQSNLLKKVSFPRTSLPIYIFISSTINFLIIYALFLAFLVVTHRIPGFIILAVIPLLILQQLFAVGFGVFLGTLNVFFRDIGYVIGVILQFWFWLTPIVYAVQIIPEQFVGIFRFNFIAPVMSGYQDIYLHNKWPDWSNLAPMYIATVIALLIGYVTFKKLDKEMVDEL